jgi:hypothetical protein
MFIAIVLIALVALIVVVYAVSIWADAAADRSL